MKRTKEEQRKINEYMKRLELGAKLEKDYKEHVIKQNTANGDIIKNEEISELRLSQNIGLLREQVLKQLLKNMDAVQANKVLQILNNNPNDQYDNMLVIYKYYPTIMKKYENTKLMSAIVFIKLYEKFVKNLRTMIQDNADDDLDEELHREKRNQFEEEMHPVTIEQIKTEKHTIEQYLRNFELLREMQPEMDNINLILQEASDEFLSTKYNQYVSNESIGKLKESNGLLVGILGRLQQNNINHQSIYGAINDYTEYLNHFSEYLKKRNDDIYAYMRQNTKKTKKVVEKPKKPDHLNILIMDFVQSYEQVIGDTEEALRESQTMKFEPTPIKFTPMRPAPSFRIGRLQAKQFDDDYEEVEQDPNAEAQYHDDEEIEGTGISKKKRIKHTGFLDIPNTNKKIHMPQLKQGILNVKYQNRSGAIYQFQKTCIGEQLAEFILDFFENNMKVNKRLFKLLNVNDKKTFLGLCDLCNYSFEDTDDKDMSNIKEKKARFNLLRAEISAGNDNLQMLNEFKDLLMDMISIGHVKKHKGMDILFEINQAIRDTKK